MAWAEAHLRTKLLLDPSSCLATTDMADYLGCAPFGERIWVSNNLAKAKAYLRAKFHLDPSSRFATIDMDRGLYGRRQSTQAKPAPVNFECGRCCAPIRAGAGSPSNSVAGAEAYLRTKLHLDPSSRLATIDMDRRLYVGQSLRP